MDQTMNRAQKEVAKKAMAAWLADPHELGKKPSKLECRKEFDLHGLHYYVFRFKKSLFGEWLLGVCGGYEPGELEHCGHVFSSMERYDDSTAVEAAQKIVEDIRAYWMEQARQAEMQKQDVQARFEKNLKYISQTEVDAALIADQFVKSENRFFLTVGMADFPTGKVVVADPLCYLASGKFCPQLAIEIPAGTYPVEVAICRYPSVGVRMSTVRMKIRDTKAVRYQCAQSTEETAAAKCADGFLSGFPVDAGMMSICDAQTAEEYRTFLDHWNQENPGKNHYNDYFAAYFAESERALPAYQREGGDFIEWTNPESGHKMVMVASGFGDGFYQSFWGYDSQNEICELIVPMINPELFE